MSRVARQWLNVEKAVIMTANDRDHYRVRAGKTRHLRQRGYLIGRQFYNRDGFRGLPKIRVDVQVTRPARGGCRDVANYHPTVKALVDGITDAGVIPDDSNAYLDGPFLVDAGRDKSLPGVVKFEIIITDLLGQATTSRRLK